MKKNIAILFVFILIGGIFSGCSKSKNDSAIKKYIKEVDEITLPKEAKIIALGEATHGNKEFQELKLDVFKVLVEKYSVKAFALEGDFGGCQKINEYIHGANISAKEAVFSVGFKIYDTKEMIALVEWMREYNSNRKETDTINFYGFDMQRTAISTNALIDYLKTIGSPYAEEITAIDSFACEEKKITKDDVTKMQSVLEKTKKDLEKNKVTYMTKTTKVNYTYALLYIKSIDECCTLSQASDMNTLRDKYMYENILWIYSMEKSLGHNKLMVSAHNGHVAKKATYKNMGEQLSGKLGEAYFAIGTDFYKTTCNLPSGEKRVTKTFTSKDPLAKMVQKDGLAIAYMNLNQAATDNILKEYITSPIDMGSLGEFYAWYMKLLPRSYRINMAPLDLYDGMIFVTSATPTDILEN